MEVFFSFFKSKVSSTRSFLGDVFCFWDVLALKEKQRMFVLNKNRTLFVSDFEPW